MRSTEPLLSTHPLTEPRKGDRFCVVLQGKEMPLDVRFVLCRKGMKCCLVLDYVLCRKGKNAVRPLDLCCVAREVMP